MAKDIDLTKAEGIIGYTLLSRDHLEVALRAPGALVAGRPELPDGNRGLGQLGVSVIETVVLDRWYAQGTGRGIVSLYTMQVRRNALRKLLDSAQLHLSKVLESSYLAKIAQDKGIGACIAMNNSQKDQAPPPALLKATVGAIVGAVWLDSNRSLLTVQALMRSFG